jgi:Spy/CpxP family protein refolding chaperone
MNDDDNHDETTAASHGPAQPGRTRRWVIAGLIVAGAGTLATGGVELAGAAVQHAVGHHRMGAHAAMDPAEMDRHIGQLVDHVLAEGTPEQKARLATIIRSTHAELAPVHQQFHQAHERARALLMQPNVDRAALESLRAEQVRQLDATSRRLVQGLEDAADMLTPEQRSRLFDHMASQMH